MNVVSFDDQSLLKDQALEQTKSSQSYSESTSSSTQQTHQEKKKDFRTKMGNNGSSGSRTIGASRIISEVPSEELEAQTTATESDTSGNCRPWSENVYYKLFLDPRGRDAKLMVLKCEISYVDIFTDKEHCLYKGRFIGAKTDGVANLFVFDLMKFPWEAKLPQSHAIELNVDIVMSSSPAYQTAESLLNLVKLEKSYLKHLHFDGQLNVMMRFAHSHQWDVKDDVTRQRVHEGLRNLFGEGVNLEVMSADAIVEEMKVDGIATCRDDNRIAHLTAKRHAWKVPKQSSPRLHSSEKKKKPGLVVVTSAESSESEEDFDYVSEDDMYYISLLDKLDQILDNRYQKEE